MFRKNLRTGLILLLLLVLGGCQTGGMAKDVVYSKETITGNGIKKANHLNISIQQAEAVEKAEIAFQKYFDIENIDKSLELKAALIEDDGILWINPYWKLSWVGKDANKPIYSAEIDAKSGEVVLLRHRPDWDYKAISKEDALGCRDTALAFIDKYALVKNTPLNLIEANSSKMQGIHLDFRYEPDKFIRIYFNGAGNVIGFERSQRAAYALQGNDLPVNRAEAVKTAQASIKRYYGEVDTSKLIDDIALVNGRNGEKTWFVYWKNIAILEGRYIRYGAHIDALSGKLCAVEGENHSIYNNNLKINAEKQQEIADRFLEQKNLSNYTFKTFDKELETPFYQDKTGSPLYVFIDRISGNVCFLSFIEMK